MSLLPVSAHGLSGLLLLLVIILPVPLALLVTWDGLSGNFRRILLAVAGANLASLAALIILAEVL